MSTTTPTADAGAAIHDCWNLIGVRGDGSCPELRQHVHCRNCPVFSRAASVLLDRDLPAGYEDQWTRHFARAAQVVESGLETVLIFRVGEEWLALPARVFEEIAELRPVHPLPHVRNGVVLGLVNVRGELLACVSLTRLLGAQAAAARTDARTQPRLLVVRCGGARLVLPADEVHGVERLRTSEMRQPPATVSLAAPSFTRAVVPWRERSVGVLDDLRLADALNRSLSSASTT